MFAWAIRFLRRAFLPRHPLWTWGGIYFGYRRGDSLFTYDGIEVGRFSGLEVYGMDGSYLGELGSSEDGYRLISSSYKKSSRAAVFAPTLEPPYVKIRNRTGLPLNCGYGHFPSPKMLRGTVLELISNPSRVAAGGTDRAIPDRNGPGFPSEEQLWIQR